MWTPFPQANKMLTKNQCNKNLSLVSLVSEFSLSIAWEEPCFMRNCWASLVSSPLCHVWWSLPRCWNRAIEKETGKNSGGYIFTFIEGWLVWLAGTVEETQLSFINAFPAVMCYFLLAQVEMLFSEWSDGFIVAYREVFCFLGLQSCVCVYVRVCQFISYRLSFFHYRWLCS